MVADLADFERVAHLAEVPLPGGEQAIHQPWRVAAAWLHALYGDGWLNWTLDFSRKVDRQVWAVLRQMIERRVNSPLTSSMGRLFDAVAALIGLRQTVNYEGQAAVELEAMADERVRDAYAFGLRWPVADPAPLFDSLLSDLQAGLPLPVISARFHNAVAALVADICVRLRTERGLNAVALSGGVFQNALLLSRTLNQLGALGFETYTNRRVPPNDGGIALGQAAVAAGRFAKE
jgi:hydrogenase maturation protein HypF